ncbi:hypothetical protein [Photobacterium damselae]|uniref:hypothetical protein n=1 Tax=Photobacterium damselae TaxID=38293 RepID=UPI0040685457
MTIEIFHLAADGCDHQVVLELDFKGKIEIGAVSYQNADVLSFYSSKDDERIEKTISSVCFDNSLDTSDVHRLGWGFDDFVAPFLNLPKGTVAKCCHLTNYLSKRYHIKLNF